MSVLSFALWLLVPCWTVVATVSILANTTLVMAAQIVFLGTPLKAKQLLVKAYRLVRGRRGAPRAAGQPGQQRRAPARNAATLYTRLVPAAVRGAIASALDPAILGAIAAATVFAVCAYYGIVAQVAGTLAFAASFLLTTDAVPLSAGARWPVFAAALATSSLANYYGRQLIQTLVMALLTLLICSLVVSASRPRRLDISFIQSAEKTAGGWNFRISAQWPRFAKAQLVRVSIFRCEEPQPEYSDEGMKSVFMCARGQLKPARGRMSRYDNETLTFFPKKLDRATIFGQTWRFVRVAQQDAVVQVAPKTKFDFRVAGAATLVCVVEAVRGGRVTATSKPAVFRFSLPLALQSLDDQGAAGQVNRSGRALQAYNTYKQLPELLLQQEDRIRGVQYKTLAELAANPAWRHRASELANYLSDCRGLADDFGSNEHALPALFRFMRVKPDKKTAAVGYGQSQYRDYIFRVAIMVATLQQNMSSARDIAAVLRFPIETELIQLREARPKLLDALLQRLRPGQNWALRSDAYPQRYAEVKAYVRQALAFGSDDLKAQIAKDKVVYALVTGRPQAPSPRPAAADSKAGSSRGDSIEAKVAAAPPAPAQAAQISDQAQGRPAAEASRGGQLAADEKNE